MIAGLYYWVGFVVVWCFIMCLLAAVAIRLWFAMGVRPKNILLWLRVFVLRRPWHLTEQGARTLVYGYNHPRTLHRWERNIIARSVRYSRRMGYKAEAVD